MSFFKKKRRVVVLTMDTKALYGKNEDEKKAFFRECRDATRAAFEPEDVGVLIIDSSSSVYVIE